MSALETAWAAGLFEGEGCIDISRVAGGRARSPRLQLAMADEDVVRRFHGVVGLGRVFGPYVRKKSSEKPQWQWMVSSFEKVQALVAMWWPWLGGRRRQRAAAVLTELRAAPVKPAYRTRCPAGHAYSGVDNRGARRCRECTNRIGRESKRRRRAR